MTRLGGPSKKYLIFLTDTSAKTFSPPPQAFKYTVSKNAFFPYVQIFFHAVSP